MENESIPIEVLKETPDIIPDESILEEEEPLTRTFVTPAMASEWRKQYLKEGHTLPSTQTYYSFIKRFVSFDGREITQKSVNRFRGSDMNMSGVASGALKCFFQFLVSKKDFPEEILNIRFDKSKTETKFPESITPEEVQKVVDSIENLRDKYLTLTLFEGGLRLSEGLRLTWGDFNWSTWLLNREDWGEVKLKHTKRDKFRTIPIPPYLMSKLYDSHKERDSNGIPIGGLMFDIESSRFFRDEKGKVKTGNKLEVEKIKYEYEVYAENYYRVLLYKISNEVLGKQINPHRLRHSKAIQLLHKNIPIETIKEFLGHQSLSSTEIYAKASSEKIKIDFKKYLQEEIKNGS